MPNTKLPNIKILMSFLLKLFFALFFSSSVFADNVQVHQLSNAKTSIIASFFSEQNQQASKIAVGVVFDLPSGWKIYGPNSSDVGIPLNIDFSGNYKQHQILWPKAHQATENFGSESITYDYYNGKITIPVIVDAQQYQDSQIVAKLNYSMCKDVCVPVNQTFDLAIKKEQNNDILQQIQQFSSIKIVNTNSEENQQITIFAFWLKIIIGAIVGGLILNIMPCVLPVLSIKLMSILKHSGANNAKIRFSFFATISGILLCFAVLSGIAFAIKSTGNALGWGFQFQNPYFLIFMIIVLVLFIAELSGFFHIEVNSFLASLLNEKISQQEAKKHIFLPNFLSGILAVLLATPCSAPFLGTAISFALTQDFVVIFAIFQLIGFGFALPYFLLIISPKLIKILPKPGNWMSKTKQIMTGLLSATIIWLLSVLSSNIGMVATFIVFFVNLLIFYVLKSKIKAKILIIIVLISSSFVLPIYFHVSSKAKEAAYNSLWKPFDESILNNLLSQNKVILIDITADWCITCKANKILALQSKEITDMLKSGEIVGLRADVTLTDGDINNFLKKHNRVAIPFNAVYGPNARQGLVASELLNKKQLLNLINKAK